MCCMQTTLLDFYMCPYQTRQPKKKTVKTDRPMILAFVIVRMLLIKSNNIFLNAMLHGPNYNNFNDTP